MLQDIKAQIDKHEIISFDIFDTLLLRPYVKPTDLFRHLEKLENVTGFFSARIEAEEKARKKYSNKEDITIDEIYDEIGTNYQSLKEKEMALERQVLIANPEMKEVYDYAVSQKKRIIIVSDMYLPEEFLTDVLHEKGYKGFENLFVSSKYGKLKYSGNLFKIMLKETKISPSLILHIGDNKHCDTQISKSLNIDAVYVESPLNRFFKQDIRVASFYNENLEDIEISIMLGIISYIYAVNLDEYWRIFGFKYAGPVIYAYMSWLREQLKKDKIKDILFVARDGYTLKQVFDSLGCKDNFSTHYIYASRIFDILFNLSYKSKLKVDELEAFSAVKKIINYYKNKDETLILDTPDQIDNCQQGVEFIETHKKIYKKLAQEKKDNYTKYIGQYLKNSKVAMIDTCSIHLSSQRLLKDFCDKLNTRIIGYYWFVNNNYASGINYDNFLIRSFQKEHDWKFVDWDFMEFLMTSPEPPIVDIDSNGKPIYKKLSKYEKTRSEVYPLVSEGAILFTKILKQFFGNIEISFSADTVTKWINNFCLIPTDYDLSYISQIYHGYDSSHDKYVPICKPWFTANNNVVVCRFLGFPLLKLKISAGHLTAYLFNIFPLFMYKKKKDKTEFKLFGIPLYIKRFSPTKIKIKLFKIIPLVTIRRKI